MVKAPLRLHRKEIDAFQRATIAAEESAASSARRPGRLQEIEVLAERSPEELEAERIERAKREGNFFNLADSQPLPGRRRRRRRDVALGTPPPPSDDVVDDENPGTLDRSFLERHARELLPAVLRAMLDASSAEKCDALHAALQESAVAALECPRLGIRRKTERRRNSAGVHRARGSRRADQGCRTCCVRTSLS